MATIQTLTADETITLVTHSMQNHQTASQHRRSIRNTAIILLMLEAGLRVGEVVQLKVCDLVGLTGGVDWLRIRADMTKTKTERCIPLASTVKVAISHMAETFWPYYGIGPDNFAFVGASKTSHITVRQVQHMLDKLSRASIRRSIRPHVLRHTFATRLMRTTNVRVVQELLGHKQLSSTQVYTHPNSEDLVKAIRQNSTA